MDNNELFKPTPVKICKQVSKQKWVLKKFLDNPSAGPIPRQSVCIYPGIGRVIATELSC